MSKKSTKKSAETQPEKLARWMESGIYMAFGLGVVAIVSLFAYVLITQVTDK